MTLLIIIIVKSLQIAQICYYDPQSARTAVEIVGLLWSVGVRAPLEFGGSEKGQSLISAYPSLVQYSKGQYIMQI